MAHGRGRQPGRPVGELLLLMVAGTVLASILGVGAALAVVAVAQPERDLGDAFRALIGTINTLLGLMAGFLAGRSRRNNDA